MRSGTRAAVPLATLVLTLLSAPVLIAVATRLDGSLAALGTVETWPAILRNAVPRPSVMLGFLGYVLFELVLLVGLPGPIHVTSRGPRYKLNGVPALIATHATIAALWAAGFSPARIYDHLGALLSSASLFALGLCLYVHLRAHGRLTDFFWGKALDPKIVGVELKQLCNSRLSMMGWSVLCVAYLAKQHELYGRISSAMWVAAGLQLVYITIFCVYEKRYYASIDIVHDRFGYYLGWGVLCWLPTLYPIAPLYLVEHPASLGWAAPVLFAVGISAMYVSVSAERQRDRVRTGTPGALIWGKPPKVVEAHYRGADGRDRASALLASGWWGIGRHFRYVPELVVATAWTLPCGMTTLLPWLYPSFLFVLLIHRIGRVEERCIRKYGAWWERYTAAVPYKLIPGLY